MHWINRQFRYFFGILLSIKIDQFPCFTNTMSNNLLNRAMHFFHGEDCNVYRSFRGGKCTYFGSCLLSVQFVSFTLLFIDLRKSKCILQKIICKYKCVESVIIFWYSLNDKNLPIFMRSYKISNIFNPNEFR